MLNKIRKIKSYIAVLMAYAMFFVSCEKDKVVCTSQQLGTTTSSSNSGSKTALRTMSFDGETLFRGIFFAEGTVASLLPEVNDFQISNFVTDANQLNQIENFRNQIVTQISKNHSTFFNDFKLAIQSGNQITIQNKLNESSSIIIEAVTALTNTTINGNIQSQAL